MAQFELDKLPGSSGFPFVGETVAFLSCLLSFVDERIRRFGRVFRTHVLGAHTVFVCSYRDALAALRADEPQLCAHEAYREFLGPVYPQSNLLLAPPTSASRIAALRLLPLLLHDIAVRAYVGPTRCALRRAFVALAREGDMMRIRPYSFFKPVVEELFAQLVLGPLDTDESARVRALCAAHFNGVVAAPLSLQLFGVSTARAASLRALAALAPLVRQRLGDAAADDGSCMVGRAAAAVKAGVIDEDQAVSVLLVLLSPAVVKAVTAGIASALLHSATMDPSEADGEGDVDAVLQEVMRAMPPIAGALRMAGGGGASRVWLSLVHAGRDASVYSDADLFRPSRWADAARQKTQGCPFAWPDGDDDAREATAVPLSFGAGARRCKGRDVAWMVMREAVRGFRKDFAVSRDGTRDDACALGGLRFLPVVRAAADDEGNGEDLGITSSYALELSSALKTSVLCYDYTGYGLSTGKATEGNCYCDIQAAYNYLVAERRIPPKRIILFGRSLGSGPTIELATRLGRNLAGVVLIAALTSCVRVVFNSATTLKFDMFANVDKVARVAVPVFCVHGMVDQVVPFSHGLELARRARFPLAPLWVRNAGHNNLESHRFQDDVFGRYAQVLYEFRHWAPPSGPTPRATARRRESAGALAMAAGCFGVRGQEAVDDGRGGRRRMIPSDNDGVAAMVSNAGAPVGAASGADSRTPWRRDDGVVRRRSAGENRERKSRSVVFTSQGSALDSPRRAAVV